MEQKTLKSYSRKDLLKFRLQVIYEMMQYPNVLCVSIGFKEVEGRYTKKLAYKIYVKKKRPKKEIEPSNQIPTSYKGFPTDVVEMHPK
jgi:hypothetical protein